MVLQQAMSSLTQLLQPIYDEVEAANIARLVLEDVTGHQLRSIRRHAQQLLTQHQTEAIQAISKRLLQKEPVQYVLGSCWFYDMHLKIDQRALIPRPETEELVDLVVKHLKRAPAAHVIDIGTGSGCIALGIKKNIPGCHVKAVDVSAEALALAKENASRLEVDIELQQLNILDPAEWPKQANYDIIVSNPPYIAVEEKDTLHANVKDYEPHLALFAPAGEALAFYDAIAAFGKQHLAENGLVVVEINERLGSATSEVFLAAGFGNVSIKKDMQGKERIIIASLI